MTKQETAQQIVKQVLEFMADNNYTNNIKLLGIPDKFIKHGATNKLKESIGLDSIGLKKEIEKFKNDSH